VENLDELKKLTKYLQDNNYIVHTYDEYHPYGRHSVAVFNSNGECLWDAICQYGSYGYERGLLEIAGNIMTDKERESDVVAGCLTADEIIERLKKWT